MARIPEEVIRKVLEATDIVTLVGSYIPLKKAGTIYKGCCPFHNEKTPSFTVSPVRQSFKCFGCGEGGSAVGFVMKYENLSFTDALRKLADKAGIYVEEEAYDPNVQRERKKRIRLIDLHKGATEWFHEQLLHNPSAEHARRYLADRGYSLDLAKSWQIGWVPEDSAPFLKWAREKGFAGRELLDSGLCFLRNENNPRSGLMGRFRDRLMFPIANDYGEIVAFSGRILGEKANTGKYINSPETSLFRKGNVVFGLNRARRGIAKKQSALVCEGQIDVIACHEAGVDHAIAPLGTAFTSQHARLLRRYTTRVVLCFDGDSAGMKAADRAFRELAPEGLHVDLVSLPPGEDPDSLLKKAGAEGFMEIVREARPFFEARLHRAQSEGILSDPSRRSEFVSEIASAIALIPDNVYQDGVITDVSSILRLGIQDFRAEVQEAAKKISWQKKMESQRSRSIESAGEGGEEFVPPTMDEDFADQWQEVELAPRIIPLDRELYQLCELAMQFNRAQEILLQQMEDLHTPLEQLRGGFLLKKILANHPDVESPASLQSFLDSLPPAEAYTLRNMDLAKPALEDLEKEIHRLISVISRLTLQKERESIVASLMAPDLEEEEKLRLLKRFEELGRLL